MIICQIIQQLSQEDSKAFKTYLRSKNKRKDTKNLALFELLKKDTSLDTIDTTLYGKPNRNAYHALSKRLQDTLIDFIAIRSFETETSEDMEVFKWILTARILYEQNIPKPAQKLLIKASKKAKELDLYAALIESDHTRLQYSHLHPEIDVHALTTIAQKNQQEYLQQEQLNMAYAHIKRALIFDGQLLKKGIQETIEEILANFNIALDSNWTFKSLYQLLEIINTAAHLDHNFSTALPFINYIHSLLEQKKATQNKQQFYQIQVFYFMANAHFRIRDFSRAQHFLDQMKEVMIHAKQALQNRFREDYLLIQSLTHNYNGEPLKAITTIENHFKHTPQNKTHPDCVLALVVFLAQQEQYKKALTTLNTLKHTDSWYQERQGIDWMIKKELITIILFYELEYLDLLESYLRSFKRKYKRIITQEARLKHFISAFTKLYKDPTVLGDSRFRESEKLKLTQESLKNEDIFMLSFFAWIKAKLNHTPLYPTTLAML